MKTETIILESVKNSDAWTQLAYDLKFEQFEKENSSLDEDELAEKFYKEVIVRMFEYGEYANIELTIDENFNITGGKIIPHAKP